MKIGNLIILLFLGSSLGAQEIDQRSLLKENRITKVSYDKYIYNDSLKQFELSELSKYDSIDTKGNIIKSILEYKHNEFFETTYSFTDDDQLSKKKSFYPASGKVFETIEMEYDENLKLIRTNKNQPVSESKSTVTYEYNKQGKVKLKTVDQHNEHGETKYKYYYKKGRLKSVKCIWKKRHRFTTQYVYNEYNLLSTTYRNSEERNWSFINYTYNDSDQLVDKSYTLIGHIIDYSQLIHLKLGEIRPRKDELTFKYKYDPETDLLESKTEFLNGSPIAYYQFRYYP